MISVALASCEGARFIAEQLRSVLPQLGPDDEVVVSDDASRDATVEIVRAIGDARVRVLVHADRQGYVKNFERALAAVRGSHVFLCDQDDVWMPQKVVTIMRALESAACVASDAVVVDEALRPMFPSYFAQRGVRTFRATALFLRPAIIGATMAFDRDFIVRHLPLPSGVPHDFWLSLNAALRGQLLVIREPLILYRRHGNAVSPTALASKRSLPTIAAERVKLLGALLGRGGSRASLAARGRRL